MAHRRSNKDITPVEAAVIRDVFRRVRTMRYRAELTQTQLGALSGLSGPGLCDLENGKVPHTSLLTLYRVADAAGHDVVVSFVPRERDSDEVSQLS